MTFTRYFSYQLGRSCFLSNSEDVRMGKQLRFCFSDSEDVQMGTKLHFCWEVLMGMWLRFCHILGCYRLKNSENTPKYDKNAPPCILTKCDCVYVKMNMSIQTLTPFQSRTRPFLLNIKLQTGMVRVKGHFSSGNGT